MTYIEGEKRRYVPLNQLEKLNINKVGVVVLVVNVHNRKIWTIEELKTKQSTGKVNGQIGIPAETRKQGELICHNVLGALTEEMGIDKNHPARENFYYIDGISYKGRYQFVVPGKKIHADVVMLVYNGNTHIDFCPQIGKFGTDEVAPAGWMELKDLQQNEKVRSGLQYILQTAIKNDWITKLLKHWRLHKTGKGNRVRQVFVDSTTTNNRPTKLDVGEPST